MSLLEDAKSSLGTYPPESKSMLSLQVENPAKTGSVNVTKSVTRIAFQAGR